MSEGGAGSKDGRGASDNDQPYVFGHRPCAIAPWPFTERQFARLLNMRGRIEGRHLLRDRRGDLLDTTTEDHTR